MKFLWLSVFTALTIGICTGKSLEGAATVVYDQRQTGKYNIHISIKDVAVIELNENDFHNSNFDPDEYYYDDTDLTIKPIAAWILNKLTTTPSPLINSTTTVKQSVSSVENTTLIPINLTSIIHTTLYDSDLLMEKLNKTEEQENVNSSNKTDTTVKSIIPLPTTPKTPPLENITVIKPSAAVVSSSLSPPTSIVQSTRTSAMGYNVGENGQLIPVHIIVGAQGQKHPQHVLSKKVFYGGRKQSKQNSVKILNEDSKVYKIMPSDTRRREMSSTRMFKGKPEGPTYFLKSLFDMIQLLRSKDDH